MEFTLNNNPYYIEFTPILTGTVSSLTTTSGELEANFLSLAVNMLRRGIAEMVRDSGRFWSMDRIANIRGSFLVTNVNGGGQAFDATYPFRVRSISVETLLELFSIIVQSNDNLSIFDVSWTFIFDPRSISTGNAFNRKIPSFVDPKCLNTWMTNVHNDTTINCAAYCIAFKTCGLSQYNFRIEKSCQHLRSSNRHYEEQ